MPYNEDFLRLIHENSYSYLNKVRSFFRVEIGVSEKSAEISKIHDNLYFLSYTHGQANSKKTHKV